MNKTILNHFNVFDELNTFYVANSTSFTAFPIIASIYAAVETNRQILLVLFEQQKQKGLGIAADKKAAKADLIAQIILNSAPASGYYFNAGNMTLYNQLNFTDSELLRKRPADLIQASNGIIKILTLHLADLTGTGVTAPSILKITNANDKYSLIINSPNLFIKAKTNVTKDIADIDRATFVIIRKELDNSMKVMMVSDKEVYDGYVKITKITHTATRKRASKNPKVSYQLTVLDNATLLPLEGVAVKFTNIRGTFITDINGTFTAELPTGGQLGKAVLTNHVTLKFAFTLTDTGLVQTIKLVPKIV